MATIPTARTARRSMALALTLLALFESMAMATDVLTTAKMRGFNADTAFASDDFDSVNTLNGNLVLSIPLGPSYTVSSGLDYQFQLTYNSRLWDAVVGIGVAFDSNPLIVKTVAYSVPMGDANAGLGWKVSLGELYPPAPPEGPPEFNDDRDAQVSERNHWLYVTPDGARHYFGPQLHPHTGEGQHSSVLFTSDSSYLRMRIINERRRVIDEASGVSHIFECPESASPNDPAKDGCWRLIEIRDAYVRDGVADSGNWIRLSYAADLSTTTITDSTGRRHVMRYTDVIVNDRYDRVLHELELTGPAGAEPVFTFGHTTGTALKGCGAPGYEPAHRFIGNGQISGILPKVSLVPLLQTLTQPDGSTFNFTYEINSGAGLVCSDDGRLLSMVLPTGGKVVWEYGMWTYGVADCHISYDSGDYGTGPNPQLRIWDGVVRKLQYASANASTPNATWRYIPTLSGESIPDDQRPTVGDQVVCGVVPRQLATTVFDPRGEATVSYYDIYNEDDLWQGTNFDSATKGSQIPGVSGWSDLYFGVNASRYTRSNGATFPGWPARRLFLSSEVYDCPDGYEPPDEHQEIDVFVPNTVSGCTLLRQEFRAYDDDKSAAARALCTNPEDPQHCEDESVMAGRLGCTNHLGHEIDCQDVNRRNSETKTVFVDDSRPGEDYKVEREVDFDGFGHYRTTFTTGNLHGGTRSVTTAYNGAPLSTPAIPAHDARWLLNLYDHVVRQDGAERARTDHCFDSADGYLLRTREYAQFGQTRSAHDVVVDYVPATASDGGKRRGEIALARVFGGDQQSITTQGCSTAWFETAIPQYARSVAYSAGQITRLAWVDPAQPTSELLLISEVVLDPYSGLVVEAWDPAGVRSAASYDYAGRIRSSDSDGMPHTSHEYCLATKPGCSDNQILSVMSAGTTEIGRATAVFDGFGRMVRETARAARSGQVAEDRVRLLRYDAGGALKERTAWTQSPCLSTSPGCDQPNLIENYLYQHDALGRATSTTSPGCTRLESDPHPCLRSSEVRTSYQGERLTTTEQRIELGTNQQQWVGRQLLFDEGGKIVEARIRSHTAPNTDFMHTYYAYDVNGNLNYVRQDGSDAAGDSVRQERFLNYDALGRLRSERHPELGLDANGAPNLLLRDRYDALGNPARLRTSDGGSVLFHEFDRLGRAVRTFDGDPALGGRVLLEQFYGHVNAGANRKRGKLVEAKRHNYLPRDAADPGAGFDDWVVRERYRYDHAAGLLTSVRTRTAQLAGSVHRTGALAFDTEVSYLPTGEVDVVTYPACPPSGCTGEPWPARAVTHSYRYGSMTEIGLQLGAFGQTLAEFEYHANGVPHHVTHLGPTGDAVVRDDIETDVTGMTRIARIDVRPGGGGVPLWSIGPYGYDGAQNVIRIGDDRYSYDRAGRLTTGAIDGESQAASYDGFGNLLVLSAGDNERQLPADSATNRLVDGHQYAYDSLGSVTRWEGRAIHYDALSMPTYSNWSEGGVVVARGHVYAPSGKRVAQVDLGDSSQLWTLRDYAGRAVRDVRRGFDGSTVWERDYVHGPTRVLTTFEPGREGRRAVEGELRRNYHADHLGSTRLVTDEAGKVVARYGFFPFGEFADAEGPEADAHRHLYTGAERDRNAPAATDDLDYLSARFYAPAYGRFLALDPLLGRPAEPQSWNRYAYALNDPMGRADPSGMRDRTQPHFRQVQDTANPDTELTVIEDFALNVMEERNPEETQRRQDAIVRRTPLVVQAAYTTVTGGEIEGLLAPKSDGQAVAEVYKAGTSALLMVSGVKSTGALKGAGPAVAPTRLGTVVRSMRATGIGRSQNGAIFADAGVTGTGVSVRALATQAQFNMGMLARGATGGGAVDLAMPVHALQSRVSAWTASEMLSISAGRAVLASQLDTVRGHARRFRDWLSGN